MNIAEMITTNKNFQTSINIDFDFGSCDKVESLIPTSSVCKYMEKLLEGIIFDSRPRANLLVGPYGKGKSHVVLAALTAMWNKQPAIFSKVSKTYKDQGSGFYGSFVDFVSSGKRLLPVIVSVGSKDLQCSLLYSLRNALRFAGLEEIMPQTNYGGAISILDRWCSNYPKTANRFESLTGMTVKEAKSKLQNFNSDVYVNFEAAYKELTSGGTFDVFDSANVVDIYSSVLDRLQQKGISGIYIVYDEFSKYLEANIDRASLGDIRLLQDIAEMCARSTQDKQLHMLLICHKSISNYIDSKLSKDKIDGWHGISGRFHEIVMDDDIDQSYELMSNAIIKDEPKWVQWLDADDCYNKKMLDALKRRYVDVGIINDDNADSVVFGCYPLHPISAFLLPRLSERVAQNERTLFTFLCSSEDGAFIDSLANNLKFVSPDIIYDYFAPLLMKEHYSSHIHKICELARTALKRLENKSLDARIVKTLALIDIVAQYELLEPTKQVIIELFLDCGFDIDEIEKSLVRLVEENSIVYLRHSNSYLKLKESSGVRIDEEIFNRSELLKSHLSPEEILNQFLLGGAIYPSRHNAENDIVRYFDCGFCTLASLSEFNNGDFLVNKHGDGIFIALLFKSPDEVSKVDGAVCSFTAEHKMVVIAAPKSFDDISSILYKYAAAKELKAEAENDEVLAEEYDIVIEDYNEAITGFVAGYIHPELSKACYYVDGSRADGISRRSQLSSLLSDLCDDAYKYTPHIASEALNKNELTGIAAHSRFKILKGLCGTYLEPRLGFSGSGQEVSMARSALQKTGVIKDISNPKISSRVTDVGVKKALTIIKDFVKNSNHTSFEELYEKLTGVEKGIGMRRGPIPIYLAVVLSEYRDEILITSDGTEKPFSAETIDDIANCPEKYELTILNWTPEMRQFTKELAELFGCQKNADRNQVAESIKRWFVSLPQLTRNTKENNSSFDIGSEGLCQHELFFKALKKPDTDVNVLLFEELPKIFRCDLGNENLIKRISSEKEFDDNYLDSCVAAIAKNLKGMFSPEAHEDSSLSSAFSDWIESLPEDVLSHVFSGINNQILDVVRNQCADDVTIVNKLAKTATSLRVEDWNASSFSSFYQTIESVKKEVEDFALKEELPEREGMLGIVFHDESGKEMQKTFNQVKCSSRSKLLKNSILGCLDDMGGAVTVEEKRQVVFEVLRSMC